MIPELRKQTLANFPDSPTWNATAWPVSAVLLHLGTNDFCPKFPTLDRNTFAQHYIELLLGLAKDQPALGSTELRFFIGCGPMGTKGDPEYPLDPAYFPCSVLELIVALGKANGLRVYPLDFSGLLNDTNNRGGCGHPNSHAHAAMARIAQPIVQRALGW